MRSLNFMDDAAKIRGIEVVSLPPQLDLPVEHNRDPIRRCFVSLSVDEKAAPVGGGNIVRSSRNYTLWNPGLEKRFGDAKRGTCRDRNSHELSIIRKIIDLASVCFPPRFIATIR